MKFLALLTGVAAIYFIHSQRGPSNRVSDAMREAEPASVTAVQKVSPTPAPVAQTASTSGLRRPIDRTRDVLGQVKERNGDGEF